MSNQKTVTVPMADGTRKHIKFTTNSLAELEDLIEIGSILELLRDREAIQKRFGIKTLRAMVYVGMKACDSDKTLEEVGNLMDLTKLSDYSQACVEALQLATKGRIITAEEIEKSKSADGADAPPTEPVPR